MSFTAQVIVARARSRGLEFNLGAGKTEAVLALRGAGAQALRNKTVTDGGIRVDGFIVRAVGAHKRLGTMVASTACPTQDAAKRIALASAAYSRMSAHFLSSQQFDLAVKLQATAPLVNATVLYARELWPLLSMGTARRLAAVRMRWLRKATSGFRSAAQGRQSDAEVRVTYATASRWSLLACRRLSCLP